MSAFEHIPQLVRNRVWCTTCGRSQMVNSGLCLQFGWPKCHGYTMTIDSPEERAAFALRQGHHSTGDDR